MKNLKAMISLSLLCREGESQEKAEERLYDFLFEGLCMNAEHQCDFWIEKTDIDGEDESLAQDLPTSSLPEGWVWHCYSDGSGSLHSPEGCHYFSYDLQPYSNSGGIEYRKNEAEDYTVFWGNFDQFKEYAESVVIQELSHQIYI